MASENLIFTKSNVVSISSVITSTFDNYCYLGIGITLLIVFLVYLAISRVNINTEKDKKKLSLSYAATRFVGSTFK